MQPHRYIRCNGQRLWLDPKSTRKDDGEFVRFLEAEQCEGCGTATDDPAAGFVYSQYGGVECEACGMRYHVYDTDI